MDAAEILNTRKTFAVIGASADESKYGYEVFKILTEHNYKVYPVNPRYDEIDGKKCFSVIDSLPVIPEVIVIILSPQNSVGILDTLAGYKNSVLWLPPDCWSEKVIEKLNESELKFIYNECPVGKLKGF